MSFIQNPVAARRGSRPFRPIITLDGAREARTAISSLPNYKATPLRDLSPLAAELGLRKLYYKDEAERFGLESFKALGGAYAVARLLQRKIGYQVGRLVSIEELATGAYKHLTQTITAVAATDGNHGRSVAAGAAMFGCRCAIVLHAGVSMGRELAIAARGAEIIRIEGNYDDSVREALRLSSQEGWELITDTSSIYGEQTCLDVMHGYTVMMAEALDQLEKDHAGPLTHIFVQGGVGGLAAAVCAHSWNILGNEAPAVVVVEPERADCLFQSAAAGQPRPAAGDLKTVMAGLATGEVSELAWHVLSEGAEFFMTIGDDDAIDVMRLLADPDRVGASIVAGESAGAGLAGLIAAMRDAELKQRLRLESSSSVLVFGTEGATDPEIYRALVGRSHVPA
jgi:diaminopropionate ammonia-lyase